MTIPNYDQEIEKRAHPENFEPGFSTIVFAGRPIRIHRKATRGSAKEAKSIQHKKKNQI